MDAASVLLGQADASVARAHARTGSTETAIRDWWRRSGRPGTRPAARQLAVVRAGIGADRRSSIAAALLIAIAVQLLLPARFSLGPSWIIPAVEALLLAGMLVTDRILSARRAATVRALSFVLVFVLVAGAAFVSGRLVVDLVESGPETNSAADLLRVGSGVWVYTVIAFSRSCTGCWMAAARKAGSGIRPSFPTWRSRSSSVRGWRRQAGGRSSPITCTWASPTPPRSARPT